MLRITVTKDEKQAKEYFDKELSRGDYYIGDETIEGKWHGKIAAHLGLEGTVTKEHFYRMCENQHPFKEKLLTQKNETGRRIFYDCNFSVPKSVSLVYGLTRNEKILDAFHKSVKETMCEMEGSMQVRVRAGGENRDRTTGNMVYAMFTHHCARPVDGKCDPQLHAHCTVFNASYDPIEDKMKASQFGQIKKDAPYYQAAFMNRLACEIKKIGFGITTTTKGGFEIAGFSRELVDKFSRRTSEIEKKAKELGITSDKAKAELGAKTRKGKLKEDSFSVLQKEWVTRLSDADKKALNELDQHKFEHNPNDISKSYDFAVSHCFERRSVLTERQLWTEVLKHGVGALKVEGVKSFKHAQIIKGSTKGAVVVSTLKVLEEEQRMLELARNSKGTCAPLNQNEDFFKGLDSSYLNEQQKESVKHLLSNTCRITCLSGAAGVGKTTTMNEVKRGIEYNGKQLFALAPSSDATEVLAKEGFQAQTLQKFLVDKKLQEKVKNQVVLVDEAGLVSVKQMKHLFEIAQKQDMRIILAGDTGQHHSVERGDALHLLEKTGVVESYRLNKVVRQKGDYKQAMEALSKGYLETGFNILDRDLGWVKEHKPKEIFEKIADEYVNDIRHSGNAPLVIAPTHKEADEITGAIRQKLANDNILDLKSERTLVTVNSLNLTEAEKKDYRNYEAGQILIFQKREKGFNKGSSFEVTEASPKGIFLRSKDGKMFGLPTHLAGSYSLFQSKKIGLAERDAIRITANGKSKEGKRLINGANYIITDFTKQGEAVLNNGWVLDKSFRHFTHGYVNTSHASQGKTVDKALVLYSDTNKGIVSREGFYVAASRARTQCMIFTTDKEDLKEAIQNSSLRLNASEVWQWKAENSKGAQKRLELLRFLRRVRQSIAERTGRVKGKIQGRVRNCAGLHPLERTISDMMGLPRHTSNKPISKGYIYAGR